MNLQDPASDPRDPTLSRPDTDDYDLLTYGEVAARLSELLVEERAALNQLMREPQPDSAEVSRLEERIRLLTASENRYRDLQETRTAFKRRFSADLTDPPTSR